MYVVKYVFCGKRQGASLSAKASKARLEPKVPAFFLPRRLPAVRLRRGAARMPPAHRSRTGGQLTAQKGGQHFGGLAVAGGAGVLAGAHRLAVGGG